MRVHIYDVLYNMGCVQNGIQIHINLVINLDFINNTLYGSCKL